MKKVLIVTIFFSITFILSAINKSEEYSMPVMSDNRVYNTNNNEYELIFDNEILNLSNLKLKLATFTSYESNIRKVYLDYPESIKEYFNDEYISYEGNNINNLKDVIENYYKDVLKNNNLYNYIDSYTENNVPIKKVVLTCDSKCIYVFRDKYPNVIVKKK